MNNNFMNLIIIHFLYLEKTLTIKNYNIYSFFKINRTLNEYT